MFVTCRLFVANPEKSLVAVCFDLNTHMYLICVATGGVFDTKSSAPRDSCLSSRVFFYFFLFLVPRRLGRKDVSPPPPSGPSLGPRSSAFLKESNTPTSVLFKRVAVGRPVKKPQHCLLARPSTRVTLPIRASALGGIRIGDKSLLPDDGRAGALHPSQKGGYPKASYLSHPNG
jgi:hypothetical protein